MSTKNSKSKKTTNHTTKSAKTTSRKVSAKKGKKCAAPSKFWGSLTLIILGVAGLIVASFLIFYTVIGSNSKSDAARFAAEYSNISKDNPFVYRSADEIVNILEHGTGVVYLGFPSCPWCQAYVGYLSEVAKEKGLDTIYYYNIEQDRKDNTEFYQKLVSILSSSLQYDEEGNRRIYVPNVTFVVDGRIIGNDLESSKNTAGTDNPTDYWTEARVSALKNRLGNYIQQVIDATGCQDTCDK